MIAIRGRIPSSTFAAFLLAGTAYAQDLPDVVERVHPSTVHVQIRSTATQLLPPLSPEVDEIFRRLQTPSSRARPRAATSTGSGFVAGADGYLVTADFVVEAEGEIDVIFPSGRRYRASLVGKDRVSGIAVLKIDATGLVPLKYGDSSKLRLGERVFAIGAPFDMPGTVTDGIVSTLGRETPGASPIQFIQTSVYINPGSAGGPLFNMRGEVVGMNTHIYTRTGTFVGLSFSVPSELVARVYEEIRRTGKVRRGRMGIDVGDAVQPGVGETRGALVQNVVPGGPAADAGLRANDLIVRFGGVEVQSGTHLTRLVQSSKPGDRVPVDYLRSGQRQSVTLVMQEQ